MINLNRIADCTSAIILGRGDVYDAISANRDDVKAYANASARSILDNVKVYDYSKDVSVVRIKEAPVSDNVFYDFNTGRLFIEASFMDEYMDNARKVCEIYAFIADEIFKFASIPVKATTIAALSIQFYIKEFIDIRHDPLDDFIKSVSCDDEYIEKSLKNRRFYDLLRDSSYNQIANLTQQRDIWGKPQTEEEERV